MVLNYKYMKLFIRLSFFVNYYFGLFACFENFYLAGYPNKTLKNEYKPYFSNS
jgi:hypothetical protein